ncbi:hypothetical protein HK098_001398 [Nowakowskiella sp. JEL0407]|nr:hypothetical protein HK098_001398 [Nowakowskiella sp. JEL0407]
MMTSSYINTDEAHHFEANEIDIKYDYDAAVYQYNFPPPNFSQNFNQLQQPPYAFPAPNCMKSRSDIELEYFNLSGAMVGHGFDAHSYNAEKENAALYSKESHLAIPFENVNKPGSDTDLNEDLREKSPEIIPIEAKSPNESSQDTKSEKSNNTLAQAIFKSPTPTTNALYIKPIPTIPLNALTRSFNVFPGFINITLNDTCLMAHFESVEYAKRAWEISAYVVNHPCLREEGGNIPASQYEIPRPKPFKNGKLNQSRVTIHVSGITMDMADLKRYFEAFKGFIKIDFHIGLSAYVCFMDLNSANSALEAIQKNTPMQISGYPGSALSGGGMKATFDVSYTPFCTRPSANPPNSVLHVTIYPANAPHPDIAKILQFYEGFDRAVFENGSCLAYFKDIDCAKRALEDLNTTTNLVTNYTRKEPRAYVNSSYSSGGMVKRPDDQLPKTTIQITNITMDRADLRGFILACVGFKKIAFYRDWCFACFVDIESASKAIDYIHQSTKMRATFTKVEYSQKYTPNNVGNPNPTLYVNNLPFNATTNEFTKLFATYEGFRDAYFFRGSCKVYFIDTHFSTKALEDINRTTNLIATYYHGTNRNGPGGVMLPAGHLNNSQALNAMLLEEAALSGVNISELAHQLSLKQHYRQMRNQLLQLAGIPNPGIYYKLQIMQKQQLLLARQQQIQTQLQQARQAIPAAPGESIIFVEDITLDIADLKATFQSFDGFLAIEFHRDFCFVQFATINHSFVAISKIHQLTTMKAIIAREEHFNVAQLSYKSVTQQMEIESAPANPVLCIYNYPRMLTSVELSKIFGVYDGFREFRVLQNRTRVLFADSASAAAALSDLTKSTNLVIKFAVLVGPPEFPVNNNLGLVEKVKDEILPVDTHSIPKCTIQLNIPASTDEKTLVSYFGNFPGFIRLILCPDTVLVRFSTVTNSLRAIEIIRNSIGTGMSASFAGTEYPINPVEKLPRNVTAVPISGNIIKISGLPSTTMIEETAQTFNQYSGCVNVHVSHNLSSNGEYLPEFYLQFKDEFHCNQTFVEVGQYMSSSCTSEPVNVMATSDLVPDNRSENSDKADNRSIDSRITDASAMQRNVVNILNITPSHHGEVRSLVSVLSGFRAVVFRENFVSVRFMNKDSALRAIETIKSNGYYAEIDGLFDGEIGAKGKSKFFDESNYSEASLTTANSSEKSLLNYFGNMSLGLEVESKNDLTYSPNSDTFPSITGSIWTPLQYSKNTMTSSKNAISRNGSGSSETVYEPTTETQTITVTTSDENNNDLCITSVPPNMLAPAAECEAIRPEEIMIDAKLKNAKKSATVFSNDEDRVRARAAAAEAALAIIKQRT